MADGQSVIGGRKFICQSRPRRPRGAGCSFKYRCRWGGRGAACQSAVSWKRIVFCRVRTSGAALSGSGGGRASCGSAPASAQRDKTEAVRGRAAGAGSCSAGPHRARLRARQLTGRGDGSRCPQPAAQPAPTSQLRHQPRVPARQRCCCGENQTNRKPSQDGSRKAHRSRIGEFSSS